MCPAVFRTRCGVIPRGGSAAASRPALSSPPCSVPPVAGGSATIKDHVIGAQLELSFIPLYEDGMLIREALDLAYSSGFVLTELVPGFRDPRDGRMLQADGIFFRD